MRMTRWMKVMCTAAVVTPGSTTNSNVAPDADIVVTGKVLLEDGQPVANTLLTMDRSTNSEMHARDALRGLELEVGEDRMRREPYPEPAGGRHPEQRERGALLLPRSPQTAKGAPCRSSSSSSKETVQLPTLQEWGGAPAAAAAARGERDLPARPHA